MANTYRFAAAFNFYMHGGINIVDPDSLSQLDTTLVALPYEVNAKATVQRSGEIVYCHIQRKNSTRRDGT